MDFFKYEHDELYCEQIKINSIAQSVKTPFYLYSQNALIDNYARYHTAFQGIPNTICYALKANSNLTLLKLLAERGSGADVVSGGELFIALRAGFSPDKIVFAGVGKTDEELQYAIETGIAAINVESVSELEVIHQIAKRINKKANVALRINPDIDVHGHPFISTGKAFNKFGIDWELAPQIYLDALKNKPMVNLVGIHNHIGSMIFNMDYYQAAAQKLVNLVQMLQSQGVPIQHIDIGGGLGVNYEQPISMYINGKLQPARPSSDPAILARTIIPIIKPLNCELFFEPGRSLIANAGVLISKVLHVKETRGNRFFCMDTGMNHLIRPSLYGAYHEVVPVQAHSESFEEADVVGPICESTDFLAQKRPLPLLKRGELIAVMTAGAYGYSLATSYNGQPLPAEVLADENHFRIIRKRQTYEDFFNLIPRDPE